MFKLRWFNKFIMPWCGCFISMIWYILCVSGYYCNGSSTVSNPVNETYGDICPKGHYCPEASPYPIACSEGYFNDMLGTHNISSCLPCTAGQYCQGQGRDLPNGPCDVGWFCTEGSIVPQPPGNQCLAGHQCPQGSPDQSACASGYHQPNVGQGECIQCPAGNIILFYMGKYSWLVPLIPIMCSFLSRVHILVELIQFLGILNYNCAKI